MDKFKKLSLAVKHTLVEEMGNYLTGRKHLNYNIELFQLDTFYVEVWRSIATNQIYWIEVTNTENVHDNYLHQISIEKFY